MPSLMETLTSSLNHDVEKLTAYLETISHPQPSFKHDSPPTTLPENAPDEIQQIREQIMDNALNIFHLAAGPSEFLVNLSTSYHYIACLNWLTMFNIFTHIPLDGLISYTGLSAKAKVPEQRLKSICRMAITTHLLAEPSPGYISHSSISALLNKNPHYRDWAVFMCQMSAPTAAGLVCASIKWPGSSEKNETAYNFAFNTDLPFFEDLKRNPERRNMFSGYMRCIAAEGSSSGVRFLVDGFDWEGVGEGVVVDIGGSRGHVSLTLAENYQNLSFIVQDLPEVISSTANPTQNPKIKYQAHDFFTPQPVLSANIYLLRMILHDWPTTDCVKILKNIIPAMGPHSKIIIMDTILPEPGSVPLSRERILRSRDMIMMQVFNSSERGLSEWEEVFEETGKLRLESWEMPVESVMGLMVLGLE
ncbi:o-methyltransferase [Aspergillus sclerotialis]|uniref:O-methyltransferase n=1 Tax=Aspergillus sclerotialis TaxID=2070753 RepID=A0A3A2ZK75_9EURO|nr:o-methyltransferase [Aspergillus sclerotialis]